MLQGTSKLSSHLNCENGHCSGAHMLGRGVIPHTAKSLHQAPNQCSENRTGEGLGLEEGGAPGCCSEESPRLTDCIPAVPRWALGIVFLVPSPGYSVQIAFHSSGLRLGTKLASSSSVLFLIALTHTHLVRHWTPDPGRGCFLNSAFCVSQTWALPRSVSFPIEHPSTLTEVLSLLEYSEECALLFCSSYKSIKIKPVIT